VASTTAASPTSWLIASTKVHLRSLRQRAGLAVAVALGMAPAILYMGLFRSPGYGDLPLIATLFILVPTLCLAGWCALDRDGRAFREFLFWLLVVQKVESLRPLADSTSEALATAAAGVSRGDAASEVLSVFRTAVTNSQSGRLRWLVGYVRYQPAVWWLVIASVLMAAFVVLKILDGEL
jgi:hypothetical protein